MSNEDIEKLGREFFNELLSYAAYKSQSEKSSEIRKSIIQRALLTNDLDETIAEEGFADDDYLDDPEGIAIPWEEKYGKQNQQKPKQQPAQKQQNPAGKKN